MTIAPYRRSVLEQGAPELDLVDPTPVQARHALAPLVERAGLDQEAADGLTGAVSEVVTNALHYGEAPVHVRGWTAADVVVVTVTDQGAGPEDDQVGMAPAPRAPGEGGLGLWLARQLCRDVAMGTTDGGFTVRLAAGPDTGSGAGTT